MTSEKIRVAILGYGGRGKGYAGHVKGRFNEYQLVDIIDNNPDKLRAAKKSLQIDDSHLFDSLDDFLSKPREVDYVFVCTQDQDHIEHAVKCLNSGYNLLLEKPVACNAEDCIAIEKLALEKNLKVAVCHVLRYSTYYDKIKSVMESGVLGKIIAIDQIENVAYWHQAHSFVRGDWRKCEESNPMILAKCCHDLDIAVYLAGAKCVKVSSNGDNYYFKAENAPEGATQYCMGGCKAKENCIYDCERIYINGIKKLPPAAMAGRWPQSRLMSDGIVTLPKLREALKDGQFGKCVYLNDNNVVDYEVVTMVFDNGIISNLTMTAFSNECFRETRIRGSHGELICRMDKNEFILSKFGEKPKRLKSLKGLDSHGGGDSLMIKMLAKGEIKTSITESVESHLIAFAAEKSRVKGGTPVLVASMRK